MTSPIDLISVTDQSVADLIKAAREDGFRQGIEKGIETCASDTNDTSASMFHQALFGVVVGIALFALIIAGLVRHRYLKRSKEAKDLLNVAAEEKAALKRPWHIDEEDCTFDEIIAVGRFGVVRKGSWQHSDVAIKEMLWSSSRDKTTPCDDGEVRVMSGLRHPRLCQFYGSGSLLESGRRFYVMEYMPGGNLKDFLLDGITANKPWAWRLQVALDVSEGLAFLHHSAFIHRDVKTSNVLMDAKKRRAKLADFGLSCPNCPNYSDDAESISTGCTSTPTQSRSASTDSKTSFHSGDCLSAPLLVSTDARDSRNSGSSSPSSSLSALRPAKDNAWIAPELRSHDACDSYKSDVFALGVVLYELLTLPRPRGARPMLLPIEIRDTPEEYTSMMYDCWSRNPTVRPEAECVADRLRSLSKSVRRAALDDAASAPHGTVNGSRPSRANSSGTFSFGDPLDRHYSRLYYEGSREDSTCIGDARLYETPDEPRPRSDSMESDTVEIAIRE